MSKQGVQQIMVTSVIAVLLGVSSGRLAAAHSSDDLDQDNNQREETLYIWASDQERKRPDFLAVIDFNEHSPTYGRVLRKVPLPPPGNVGNEPHHCHLSADKNILACGGLLSVLSGTDKKSKRTFLAPRCPASPVAPARLLRSACP